MGQWVNIRVSKIDCYTFAYTTYIYKLFFHISAKHTLNGPVLGVTRSMSIVLTIGYLHVFIVVFFTMSPFYKECTLRCPLGLAGVRGHWV
jgi:hypothetical protein